MSLREKVLRSAPRTAIALAIVFLGLSLLGYDPADAPGWAAAPPNAPPQNPCGPVGAALAHALFISMGWASWLFLLGLTVLVLPARIIRSRFDQGLATLGFAILLLVTAGLFHKLLPALSPRPPVGSGGYTGAFAALFLQHHFGLAGMMLILLASGAFGLALCHDVILVGPISQIQGAIRSLRRRRITSAAAFNSAPGPRADRPAWEPAGILEATGSTQATLVHPPLPVSRNGGEPPRIPGPNPTPANRKQELAPVETVPPGTPFELPPLDLLEPPRAFPIQEHEAKINARAMLLERTLLDFNYQVRVVQIDTGPVITQFEIELEAGLRVSRIMSLADDLAIALAVPSVRIVAPIPGKTTVGIEVPNDHRAIVRLGDVISASEGRYRDLKIPLFLGKDVKGLPLIFDLADMPHLLMAGRTGTGKSVCLNAMILSILMCKRPDEVKLILIDPKKVELTAYRRIPHLMHPVVLDMKKAEPLLAWLCEKMDERYEFLRRAEVRNIQSYNALGPDEILRRLNPEDEEDRKRIPTFMPYIVVVIDELADVMMTADKQVEQHIVRLAQLARAVGMHLILATQKPVVDVVTGLIKGNLPARIAFQVASRSDSRVVLDEMGADKLLGNGDMLFLVPGTSHIVRAQGTYVSDSEVNGICRYLERYPVDFNREMFQLQVNAGPGGKDRGAALKERDDLYEPAIEVVIREQRGSCSLLQRALGIGYGRAARLIDFMAEDGIVGEFKSGSAREVLYTWDEWEQMKKGAEGATPDEAAA